MEAPQPQKKKILLFFTRHGERNDKILNSDLVQNFMSNDPTISENGKTNAVKLGAYIREYIQTTKPEYEQTIK